MKRIWILSLILMFSLVSIAQKTQKVQLKNGEDKFELLSKSTQSLTLKTSMSSILLTPTETKGGSFVNLFAPGTIKIFNEGSPNLPVVSKLIEVPQDAVVEIRIISFDEEIINLSELGFTNKISPAQPSISKSTDPIDVPFYYNEAAYNKDEFMYDKIAIYEESGMMRATRFGRIEIRPIQYNPAKNQIRVLNNLVIEINFKNGNQIKTLQLKEKYASAYFDMILNSELINYDNGVSKEFIQQIPLEMVIVSARMFEAQLAPFIEWKEQKGYNVTVAYTDVIGTTTAAIKTYLQGLYTNATAGRAPSFVLFVGDIQQIPAWSGNSGSHVTDLRYCEYTNDDIPEVYYGRFSAQTTAQLQPQIDKTLEYEKYLMPDPSYLAEVVMVAGDDTYNEIIYGNGQINYGTTNYFNASNSITSHTYLQPLDNNAASTQIRQNISNGVAFGNYTAHCSPEGWATPSFVTSNISSLTNASKYGLLVGNCCQSNQFNDSECFGEALLRAQNKGAIGYIGGSNSTYWDEDYWWGTGVGTCVEHPTYNNFGTGAYDGVFHNLANEVNNMSKWYTTQGQMLRAGQLAVEASSSSRKEYYWEIYHLMGDPTVTNYIGIPTPIAYEFSPDVLMIGSSSFDISTAAHATVALHQDGERIAVVMTDENGDATIDLENGLTGGEVTLVITAQFKQPKITTVQPIASSEPYILVSDYTPENVNYASTSNINISFQNVADAGYDAANVVATLTTSDPYVTIVDGTENVGTINGGQTVTLNNAFSISIANNVPDQHEATLTVTMVGVDAKYTWTSNINITINAPLLEGTFTSVQDINGQVSFSSSPVTTIAQGGSYSYNVEINELGGNGNGNLDPGEIANLTFTATNNGHAGISNSYGRLTSTSEYITINSPETFIADLGIGDSFVSEFNITVDESAPVGTMAAFEFEFGTVQYEDLVNINLPIGLVIEDFESGNLTTYNWVLDGDANWTASNTGAHAGTYCAKSGDIDNNETTSMQVTLNNVPAGQTMSFWYKASSESGWDFLTFYVNGQMVEEWSGNVAWTEKIYTFTTAGDYTIKFEYSKDGSVTSGDDFGWIDDIVFPVAPTKGKDVKAITIDCTTKPSWITFVDNGDGTATLTGTAPNANQTDAVVLTASNGTTDATQEFSIRVGVISIYTTDNVVRFYPNPTKEYLNITLNSFENNTTVTLIDVNGKVVLNQEITSEYTQINLSNLSQGVYILNMELDGQILQNKIIIE